jgi:NAD(P)H-nitrite reductase large subunit
MIKKYEYIVVGAGIAGFKAAETIRRHIDEASLLLINGENRLPYKRTRIDKNIHNGFTLNQFALADTDYYKNRQIKLLIDRVTSINLKTKSLQTERRNQFSWGKLILAMGGTPNWPDVKGNGKSDIFLVRTADDAEELIRASKHAEKIIVAGGGVQGIELVDQFVKAGKQVTLVHNGIQLMNHHFDQFMAQHIHQQLEKNGVKVICNEKVEGISKTSNEKYLVKIGDIIQIVADLVVFSVGSKPQIALAQKAGLATNRGILVNEYLQTSHPDVYAAGDVAEHPGGHISGLWHAAESQGILAGSNAAGNKQINNRKPFRLKTEVFGQYYFSMNAPITNKAYLSESIQINERYYHAYFHNNQLKGLLMINDKAQAKLAEQAVQENWCKTQFKETFGK